MAPLLSPFRAEELPTRAQADSKGRKRKVTSGGNVDLTRCELLSLMQYKCTVDQSRPLDEASKVICAEVPRLFRR